MRLRIIIINAIRIVALLFFCLITLVLFDMILAVSYSHSSSMIFNTKPDLFNTVLGLLLSLALLLILSIKTIYDD